MAIEMTSEQAEKLETWAGQRDALLLEISNLRKTEEGLQKTNKELAAGNTDIQTRMDVIKGRIEELKIKEAELPPLMLKEVAFLESKKLTLESEIMTLGKLLEVLTTQKVSLESDVSSALATFDVVKGEALLLDKIVNHVTTVSKGNSDKIELLVSNLAKSLEEIIEVNKKNVLETNIVVDKVPAMLIELQKNKLIRTKI